MDGWVGGWIDPIHPRPGPQAAAASTRDSPLLERGVELVHAPPRRQLSLHVSHAAASPPPASVAIWAAVC